jgi:hypothetical protein
MPLLFTLFNINNFIYNCFISCISRVFVGLVVNYLKPNVYSNNIKNININNFILLYFEKLTDDDMKKLKNIDNNIYSTFLFQRLCYNELVKQLKFKISPVICSICEKQIEQKNLSTSVHDNK